MLTNLTIADFAIVDQLGLRLTGGLNVLTGETGAGKSIVIDAVSSLLGSRIGSDQIRTGADQARVEGIFNLPSQGGLGNLLTEHGLDGDEDTLIVSREVHRSGRSVARINGRAVTLAVLQQIGRKLIDIHGQGEHLSLLRVPEHVDFLDGYAGLRGLRGQVAEKVAALRQVRRELDELLRDERELARRADLLKFQVDEIDGARLQPGEDDDLRRERDLLANAERLMAGADAAYKALYEVGDEGRSAVDLVGVVISQVTDLARVDPSLEPLRQSLEDVGFQLEDAARDLRTYRDRVEYNPARLETVEERLELIQRLERKYGSTIEEVQAFAEKSRGELDGLGHREERAADLRSRESALLVDLARLAGDLSAARRLAGDGLAAAVVGELADLNMAKTRFRVAITQTPDPDGVPVAELGACAFDSTGVDRVEFLIATNPGEPEKPLARIASGGETSRLMLALKTILARVDAVGVLIFDEIDVGIGGRSGLVVGQKLAALARERQVICVTHLPQIASFADAHHNVAKRTVGERTTAGITTLDGEGRVAELAVMLGGTDGSLKARENAAEMLRAAAEWKGQLAPPGLTLPGPPLEKQNQEAASRTTSRRSGQRSRHGSG